MAKFKPGQTGNAQGRPVGARDKISKPLKDQLSDFLNKKIQELPSIWSKLSPRDQAGMLKDMYPYFMARMETVSVDLNIKKLTDEQLTELIIRLFKTSNDVEKVN